MLSAAHNIPTSYLSPMCTVVFSRIFEPLRLLQNVGRRACVPRAIQSRTMTLIDLLTYCRLSCSILTLKYVEVKHELDGNGQFKTPPKRTVTPAIVMDRHYTVQVLIRAKGHFLACYRFSQFSNHWRIVWYRRGRYRHLQTTPTQRSGPSIRICWLKNLSS